MWYRDRTSWVMDMLAPPSTQRSRKWPASNDSIFDHGNDWKKSIAFADQARGHRVEWAGLQCWVMNKRFNIVCRQDLKCKLRWSWCGSPINSNGRGDSKIHDISINLSLDCILRSHLNIGDHDIEFFCPYQFQAHYLHRSYYLLSYFANLSSFLFPQ